MATPLLIYYYQLSNQIRHTHTANYSTHFIIFSRRLTITINSDSKTAFSCKLSVLIANWYKCCYLFQVWKHELLKKVYIGHFKKHRVWYMLFNNGRSNGNYCVWTCLLQAMSQRCSSNSKKEQNSVLVSLPST